LQALKNGDQTLLRQPIQSVRMVLERPSAAHFDALDDWLKTALDIDPAPFVCYIPRTAMTQETFPVMETARRCLLAARALLQAAGVPCFDPCVVFGMIKDERRPFHWIVKAGLARIDGIPDVCYTLAVEAAIEIVRNSLTRAELLAHGESRWSEAEKALRQLKSMVISGKSTIPLLRCAHQLDIPFLHLGGGVYQLGWGAKSRRLDRSITEAESLLGAKLAQHKVWSAGLLRAAGLPAPEHGIVVSEREAVGMARRFGWPVIVKPVDLDRGEGVTVGVRDDTALLAAFTNALQSSKIKQVVIEREVPGICHRLLVANGRLLYAAKRLPKSVMGDGQRTVAELIESANQDRLKKAPWMRSEPFPDDDMAVRSMEVAGFNLSSIPSEGKTVPLRPFETTRWGGQDEDVTGSLHPDNRQLALRAAALFDLHVAGIDIMSADIAKPWHENGAIINEVNFSPTLGDGPVSAKYITSFMQEFIDGDGRIPIEVFVGAVSAMDGPIARKRELTNQGIRCFLAGYERTFDDSGAEILFTFRSLFQRCRALLMNPRMEALILVAENDEFLYTGLPVDCITRLILSEHPLTDWKNPKETISPDRFNRLKKLLENFVRLPKTAIVS